MKHKYNTYLKPYYLSKFTRFATDTAIHRWPTVVCLLIGLACLHLTSCKPQEEPIYLTLTISECAPMPLPRMAAMAFADDTCGYVFGGRLESRRDYLNDMWRYSPQSDSWTQLPTPPLVARAKGIAERIGDFAYIGLGYAGNSHLDEQEFKTDFWRINLHTGDWEQLPNFPSVAASSAVSFVHGNTIYVSGGYYDQASCDTYAFDTETLTWSRIADNTICTQCPVSVTNGKRFFMGLGERLGNSIMAEFFPDTQSWGEAFKVDKNKRIFARGVHVEDQMLIIGGRTFGGSMTTGYIHDEISLLIPDEKRMVTCGRLPVPQEQLVGFTIGKAAYVGLGNGIEEKPTAIMWRIQL